MKRIALISAALLYALAYGSAHPAYNIASNYIKDPSKVERKMEKKALRKSTEKNEVSLNSIGNFKSDFGVNNDVRWTRTDYFDEARFIESGQPMTAYYDFDGQLIGTMENKSFEDLPAHGQKQIQKKYKDYDINSVVFYRENQVIDSDLMLYGAQFENTDNYFVELSKGTDRIVLQVTPVGSVFFFKQLE